MQKIQKIKQLNQLQTYIRQSSQTNQGDILYIENNLCLQEPLNKFIHEKLQFLQDILLISNNALNCVIDLRDQKQELQQNNNSLKTQLNYLCQANNSLRNRVQQLLDQVHAQNQQIIQVNKRQQLLQVQTSMIKKELQETKSRLSENQQKMASRLEEPQKNSFGNILVESKHDIDKSISNIKKELKEIDSATVMLTKKMTLQNWSNSQQSVNSYSHLSSTIPYVIKNKLNSEDLKSLRGLSRIARKQTVSQAVNPTKLNEDLASLNLIPCDSIIDNQESACDNNKRIDQDSYLELSQINHKFNRGNTIQRSDINRNKQDSFFTPQSTLNLNQLNNQCECKRLYAQNELQKQINAHKNKVQKTLSDVSVIIKKSKKQNLNDQFVRIIDSLDQKNHDCLCRRFTNSIKKIDNFLFKRIVRDRIQHKMKISRISTLRD